MMRHPIRILLDVDGPVADFVGALLATARRIFPGRDLTREQIKGHGSFTGWGLSESEGKALLRAVDDGERWCERIDPHEHAFEGVARLRTLGVVWCVTAPWTTRPTWDHERREWLLRHFGIPRERVIMAIDKTAIDGDVLIDDNVATCRAWRADPCRRAGVLAIVWNTPHNAHEEWTGARADTWDDVARLVYDGPWGVRRC